MTDAAGTSPSRRRWLFVALTVSAALNLFFIGMLAGGLAIMQRPPPQRDRLEQITARMRLNPAQEMAFHQFQKTTRQPAVRMHHTMVVIWTQLANPATAADQIAPLLNQTVQIRTAFQQDVATALGKFLASLTPEQRVTFIHESRAAPHPNGPLHRLGELLR